MSVCEPHNRVNPQDSVRGGGGNWGWGGPSLGDRLPPPLMGGTGLTLGGVTRGGGGGGGTRPAAWRNRNSVAKTPACGASKKVQTPTHKHASTKPFVSRQNHVQPHGGGGGLPVDQTVHRPQAELQHGPSVISSQTVVPCLRIAHAPPHPRPHPAGPAGSEARGRAAVRGAGRRRVLACGGAQGRPRSAEVCAPGPCGGGGGVVRRGACLPLRLRSWAVMYQNGRTPQGEGGLPPPPQTPLSPPLPLQMHTPARTGQCWSRQTPAWTRSVPVDAPGQRHGQQPRLRDGRPPE